MLFVKVRHGFNKEDWNQLDHPHQRDTKVAGNQSNATWRSLKATQANKTSSEISLNVGNLAVKHQTSEE